MGNLHNLLQWWNLLFALPLVIGVLFSLVTALGFVSAQQAAGEHGEAAHDTVQSDLHPEAGGEAEHHLPAEAEQGEMTHEASAEHSSEAGHHNHHHESLLTQLLEAFGIGRGVPVSVMLPFCLMLWGVLGLVSNQALQPLLRFPAVYVWVSMALSLVGTSLIARSVSGVVARSLQMGQVPSVSRERLIGATGTAVFAIDSQGGVADVRDTVGTVHRIPCRVRPGNPPIPAGSPVVVADYESDTGRYVVEENPFADSLSHEEGER